MNGPIDEGNVSLKSTIWLIVCAFGLGGWLMALQLQVTQSAETLAEMKPKIDALCEQRKCMEAMNK